MPTCTGCPCILLYVQSSIRNANVWHDPVCVPRVEDIPLSVLAGYAGPTQVRDFAKMHLPRAAPLPAGVQDGDRLELHPEVAMAQVTSVAIVEYAWLEMP